MVITLTPEQTISNLARLLAENVAELDDAHAETAKVKSDIVAAYGVFAAMLGCPPNYNAIRDALKALTE
jgi:coenzyme F420-reducing hydrogenase gamma subunit